MFVIYVYIYIYDNDLRAEVAAGNAGPNVGGLAIRLTPSLNITVY